MSFHGDVDMSLYSIFKFIEASELSHMIGDSPWVFPVVESIHLCALAALGGGVLLMDLRLLGLGLKSQPLSVVYRGTRPWMLTGFTVLVLTGILLFVAEATDLYGKEAFWVKMIALALACGFTFFIRNPVVRIDRKEGVKTKLVGGISIALWFTVAVAGRWIGFS